MITEAVNCISKGQLFYLASQMSEILQVVPEGARVAIEGTPIYLGRPWRETHSLGYDYLLPVGRNNLLGRSCIVEHVVLLDDYTVGTRDGAQEYLSRIRLHIDRVEWESGFVYRARELAARLQSQVLRRDDGRQILFLTPSGRYTCALLDAVFQKTKDVEYNVIVHPSEFSHEQEEMRRILLEAENGSLPFNLVSIFFKGGSISKVYTTDPNGRMSRVAL